MSFVFLYTREAHPGENYPHHTDFEQKLRHAREMATRDGIERPMLVDDLDGTVHRAYGTLPNMAYVIGGGGRLVYRAAWTDAEAIDVVVNRLVRQRTERQGGAEHRPYYAEWQPNIVADRQTFVELLLDSAGPRAVSEYIDAVEHSMSPGVARPLRDWWTQHREQGE
ncbi:MAG: hypothetical protein GKS06_01920 [Acidobacteria bacterium]|nr:hypothetical protein [Acidobacteriota bacterium]